MTKKEKEQLRYELHCLEILGWDHCDNCSRSQNRFEFYYQEQFDASIAAEMENFTCVFCDGELKTYCEDGKVPFGRSDDWKVPTREEFEQIIAKLNEKFDTDKLKIGMFKSRCGDYMNRPTKEPPEPKTPAPKNTLVREGFEGKCIGKT